MLLLYQANNSYYKYSNNFTSDTEPFLYQSQFDPLHNLNIVKYKVINLYNLSGDTVDNQIL